MATAEKPKGGLEDVVATSSAICYLDGERGVLAYCGYDIHDLAKSATFEEVCFLLWHRRLPSRAELGDLQSQLAAGRAAARADHPADAKPPAGGRDGCAAHDHVCAGALRLGSRRMPHLQAQYRKAVRLTAQVGTIVATWGRLQDGGGPLAPDPAMGHAANFLYMLTGERPERDGDSCTRRRADPACGSRAECVDVCRSRCRRHADRHLFRNRRCDRHAEGPLHGGANAEVMKHAARAGETATGERVDDVFAASWRARKRSPGLATASTRPKTRAPRICVRCRGISASDRQHRLVRHVAAHRGAGQGREEAESRTSTSTRRPPTTRSASRSISTRRSLPSAECPAGPRIFSSNTPTIA